MDTVDAEERLDEIQNEEGDDGIKTEKELREERRQKWNFGLEIFYNNRKNAEQKLQQVIYFDRNSVLQQWVSRFDRIIESNQNKLAVRLNRKQNLIDDRSNNNVSQSFLGGNAPSSPMSDGDFAASHRSRFSRQVSQFEIVDTRKRDTSALIINDSSKVFDRTKNNRIVFHNNRRSRSPKNNQNLILNSSRSQNFKLSNANTQNLVLKNDQSVEASLS